ncbi:diguanylate cyclase regulator RdcB family protein [Pseudomonas sp. KFB-139]|uniref:Diguanylate cyclase regulator RdcB family protein n=1 Tax=Pseudomonas serbiensis TaxID=3064350 RepID=A0ABT9CIZ5_9PSED|nr:diguanylate cyclase regulator RdcB family protein [Pseudomonas sp. KFB-138]MDO7925405.1 diguanylate cyclase regulator RdcB family protein [Pseudomonas sp. KFB-138]
MSEAQNDELIGEMSHLLTCLPEKFVVDFANGIDVSRERQRHMSTRTGMFDRLYDGFTGKTARNQAEINASLTDGVEGALKWLGELTQSMAKSNRAIYQVQTRVNRLKQDLATLANYSADTRYALEQLSQHLGDRCSALELKVAQIDSTQRAQLHLESVMAKWGAGRFAGLSLTGRCYAVFEELRWGAFGDHYQAISGTDRQQLLENLANRSIIQLSLEAKVGQGERIATRNRWLARPSLDGRWSVGEETLSYLGDWSCPDRSPMTYAISQMPDELPLRVPLLGSARRMAEGLVSELFLETSA